MAISQKLHTKLVQKLILTPSLQQAIKLLPMSTLELADLLNQEMVENPLLEEVPTEDLQPAEQAQQDKTEADKPNAEKSDQWDDADFWSLPESTAELIEFIASGALDELSGRYIHATADDWRAFVARDAEILERDLLALRLRSAQDA